MEHNLKTKKGALAYLSEAKDQFDWNDRVDQVTCKNHGYPKFWREVSDAAREIVLARWISNNKVR